MSFSFTAAFRCSSDCGLARFTHARSLMIRRRKMDVLTQLPAKHRRTVVVKVSPADATKLRELRQNLEAADRDRCVLPILR